MTYFTVRRGLRGPEGFTHDENQPKPGKQDRHYLFGPHRLADSDTRTIDELMTAWRAGTVADPLPDPLTQALEHCRQALAVAMNAPCTVDRDALRLVVSAADRRE